jgi:Ran GTPase-activating protein (RanGAP) involved in mRNA processing and transport
MNSTLQSIGLWGNDIGDEGAKWMADAIKVNSVLQEIRLWNNSIGSEGAKWLGEALNRIRRCKKFTLGAIILEMKEQNGLLRQSR